MTLDQDWRKEVTHRLRSYRERKRNSAGDSQPALPFGLLLGEQQLQDSGQSPDDTFDEPLPGPGVLDDDQYEDPLQATLAAAAARVLVESSPAPVAPPEPEIVQPLLIDVSTPPEVETESSLFSSTSDEDFEAYDRENSHLLPVAELSIRRRAAAVDAVCLLLAFSGILGLFAGFGGRLTIQRLDAFVAGSIFALLYAQYFTLFTMMGGATPGMILTGLRLVSYDGSAPAPTQLMWRSFGYILSGSTAMLGFLWAFWDEDHLSWHDRLSRTYITPAGDSLDEAIPLKSK